jgi:organic hydroperoxide reductase OsmC/OhrA
MGEHRVRVAWTRDTPDFTYETYGRDHAWTFKDGVTVAASAAREWRGSPGRIDPEEALVAAIASCHMLSFLAIAARKRHIVDAYQEDAAGYLEKNELGRLAVTRVVLRPRIVFGGDWAPMDAALRKMHDQAHRECFIANSVKTNITVLLPGDPDW